MEKSDNWNKQIILLHMTAVAPNLFRRIFFSIGTYILLTQFCQEEISLLSDDSQVKGRMESKDSDKTRITRFDRFQLLGMIC